jgi:outer membrane protein OmpA-like peptidoglycan-associated protein
MISKKHFICLILGIWFSFAEAQEQISVFFESNKSECSKLEAKKLQDWILANKEVKIIAIHGFTDEDGTSGFNDTLAKKRVTYIYNKVKDQIKIREDFKTISFGENFKQEAAKSQNRKATVYYLLPKDFARENEILGIKKVDLKPIEQEISELIPIEEEAMNFPENATLEDKIKFSQKGTLIRLNDINFYVNTFAIMPTSKRAIDELIYVLDTYPKLKIEIQGHICCVDKDARNLSTERAKQVKRILVSEGISERRIKTKGFGVSKPKFAIPEKSDYEAARNRRVEIMILDK